ncbi:transcriptional regulation of mitochondrial recombination-domain-containing protein [Phaeosphaeria sp. MPI-PUGE-AT-0046c]|nr:transcriptional regulation of mitochondrial recombination-domain-containing protein [Phaeosphaeria sp. MPI-PUGE-AT-0046c]
MPRAITRLRYRTPPSPATFFNRLGQPITGLSLEQRVAKYVAQQSNPRHIKLQIVANPKARAPAPGKHLIQPYKPFTLKDVVDPEGKARHGEIIYIFRNVKSNQVIYSLQELLKDFHLEQLPFIGKHSKPPVLRPDEWTPHCVVTFPTPEQGQSAFKQLREYRQWHEYAWSQTNPEWKRIPIKQRMKKIMDQRANTSADLAAVLRAQAKSSRKMTKELKERYAKENDMVKETWAKIDAVAKNVESGDAEQAAKVKALEDQVKALTAKLSKERYQSPEDQKHIKQDRKAQLNSLRKIQYAIRKSEEFTHLQQELKDKAAPANELGAEQKLDELKKQAIVARAALANPDPTRTPGEVISDRAILVQLESEIKQLEDAFEAKQQLEDGSHPLTRSVLPKHSRAPVSPAYTLKGIRVQWADLQDALYARDQWPKAIEHEDLGVNKVQSGVALLSAEAYAMAHYDETSRILQALQPGQEQRSEDWLVPANEPEPEPEPKPRGGILGRLFGGKSAEARA